jgi:hypothetical protein
MDGRIRKMRDDLLCLTLRLYIGNQQDLTSLIGAKHLWAEISMWQERSQYRAYFTFLRGKTWCQDTLQTHALGVWMDRNSYAINQKLDSITVADGGRDGTVPNRRSKTLDKLRRLSRHPIPYPPMLLWTSFASCNNVLLARDARQEHSEPTKLKEARSRWSLVSKRGNC